ncbi:MAG: GNAT family N-acetyltransferase, partial [Nanoarchaeota archaeon]
GQEKLKIEEDQTKTDINIKDRNGYLLWICVERDKRGQGHGSSLYNCIERFFREQECERIILTPSGTMPDGRKKSEWWRNRGFQFREENPNEMDKVLK